MMRLLLTGGGTLGSVTPLLALHDALKPEAVFWIGTRWGIEQALITNTDISYFWIVATKFRRYIDLRTLIAPLLLIVGFLQAMFLLLRLRPTHVIGAGGYVAVPVIWAAWLLRIPSYTIQLDVLPGLANRLVAPFVKKIFVTFNESQKYFSTKRVIVSGAPVRSSMRNAQCPKHERPLLLVIGGGTGSQALNELVWAAKYRLIEICNVVHLSGRKKMQNAQSSMPNAEGYRAVEFMDAELPALIASADIVLTRAGMGTLSELAARKKAAIVIPLPESPQEANADVLARAGAAVVRSQREYTADMLISDVKEFLKDRNKGKRLGENLFSTLPSDGAAKIVDALL